MESKKSSNSLPSSRSNDKSSGNNENHYVDYLPAYGIHPVTHLLRDTNIPVPALIVQEGLDSKEIANIKRLSLTRKTVISTQSKAYLDAYVDGNNHQGVIARIREHHIYKTIDFLEKKKFVLILDHLQDPQNFGAILRTADQFGVDAVVIPKHRSVGLVPSVVKASSGAVFFVPIVQESSLIYVLEKLKQYGFWIYSTSVRGGERLPDVSFKGKIALILGNESHGVSEQLDKNADFMLKIPVSPVTAIDSLNVSVATGILLYDIMNKMGQLV